MRISCKAEYGFRALLDLAQHHGGGPIQSHDIAERQGISENYLNQMLILLRRAGLVSSTRGPQGGHQLARAPEEITLLEALLALEGPLLPLSEQLHASIETVVVRTVLDELRSSIEQHLSAITLAELLQRRKVREGQPMYYI